ncbi:MAG: c-type cytochrome [Gemmatimonadetes bacterium]|nr:c-type cytochrome [Gemmatimonadota bacterium]
MSKETNRLLGHADEADGIEEYDNPLPDWWLGLFWFTIIWGIAYGVHYHFIGNRSQESELAAEMAAADARWPEQAQAEIQFAMSDAAVEAGAPVYTQNCAPCHAAGGEGVIGPSFLDDEWIHGGTATEVIAVIRNGVLEKGMVAWDGILSPEQINNVAAYVLDLHMDATGRTLEDVMSEPGAADGADVGGDAASDEGAAEAAEGAVSGAEP